MKQLSLLFIVVLLFSVVSIVYAGINENLFEASGEGNNIEAVKTLLDKGADINAKDNDGSTALKLASEKGYTDIIKLLKQAGAKEQGKGSLPVQKF